MISQLPDIVEYKFIDKERNIIKWTLRNSTSTDIHQRILPAFYFDLIIPTRGCLIVDEEKITSPFISPILMSCKVVTIGRKSEIDGYRLNPIYFKEMTGINPQMLQQKPNKLLNLIDEQKSKKLLKELLKIEELGEGLPNVQKHKQVFDLLEKAKNFIIYDPNLPVHKMAKELNISDRWLQKLFKEYFNISPADLKKLLKFTRSINLIAQTRANKLTDIAHDNHYFDQSHFIKNFKTFSGLRPSQFAKLEHDFFKVMNSV